MLCDGLGRGNEDLCALVADSRGSVVAGHDRRLASTIRSDTPPVVATLEPIASMRLWIANPDPQSVFALSEGSLPRHHLSVLVSGYEAVLQQTVVENVAATDSVHQDVLNTVIEETGIVPGDCPAQI